MLRVVAGFGGGGDIVSGEGWVDGRGGFRCVRLPFFKGEAE